MDAFIEYIPVGQDKTFPVMKNLWDFFSRKGSKTVFLSVGTSETPTVELHISESLGCKIHLFDTEQSNIAKWTEIQEILKTRKTTETTSEFAKPALKRWVLPNNLVTYPSIPQFQSGPENLKTTVEEICKQVGESRVDILKVTLTEQTYAVLYALLHYGFRPGLVLLSWNTLPDTTVENTLLAGHLQLTGYGLAETVGNNYLYVFHDKNTYELCSWQNNAVENPLLTKLTEAYTLKRPTQ